MRFILATVTVALTVLSACSNSSGNSNPPIQNNKPGQGSIVVLGDSLAAGSGGTDPKHIPAGCLAQEFGRTVSDMAVPGLTSEEILAKADLATADSPSLVFVSSGGNDAIREHYKPGSYSAQKSLSEMSSLFERLISSGALVIYLGLNPPYPGTQRMTEISDLARQKGVIVVDGMAGFWGNNDLMADQFHPNDKGYAIMCSRIVAALNGHYP